MTSDCWGASRLKRGLVLALGGIVLAVASAGCQAGASVPLKLGDCFDVVSSTDAEGNGTTTDNVVDCAQPHDGEVFLVFDYPDAPASYPGDEAIGTIQQSTCDAAFKGYVGKDSDLSSYTIDYVRPDVDTWASGDHTIDCLLEDGNGGQLTGSAKGTKK